jgi:hypothetical protein
LAQADTITVLKGQKMRLVGADDKRISLLIRNMDNVDEVHIGFSDQVASFSGGYPLKANQELTLITQGDVWVLYAAGVIDEIRIAFLTQYTVELP